MELHIEQRFTLTILQILCFSIGNTSKIQFCTPFMEVCVEIVKYCHHFCFYGFDLMGEKSANESHNTNICLPKFFQQGTTIGSGARPVNTVVTSFVCIGGKQVIIGTGRACTEAESGTILPGCGGRRIS